MEKNHSQTSTKNFLFTALIITTTTIMVPSNQPSPAKMCKQAEGMRRICEARDREEWEKEEALLQAAEEEERWEVERKWQEEEGKQR